MRQISKLIQMRETIMIRMRFMNELLEIEEYETKCWFSFPIVLFKIMFMNNVTVKIMNFQKYNF